MKTFKVACIWSSIVLLLLTAVSCESDNEDYIALSKELRLDLVEIDGKVQLKWTLAKINDFREYRVYRSKDRDRYYQSSLIYSGNDFFTHSFVDENPNYLGTNYYWVEALGGNDIDYSRLYRSNVDSINIGDYASFSFFPQSVIFNKEENLLGFIDGRRKFTLYNYEEEKVVGTKDVNYSFRYPCFGNHNGQTELYLYENNSNEIGVFEPETLMKLANIPLSNQYLYSVASNNAGKIYASYSYGSSNIEVVNRDLSGSYWINSSYDEKFLQYSEAENALIANEDDSYSYLYVYNADSDGNINYNNYTYSYIQGYNYACVKEDPATGHIYVQPHGRMKMSGTNSTVFSSFGNCQDIAFNSSFVFTAPFSLKELHKYDRNGNFVESIALPGYPVYLFVDDDRLIVLFVEQQISISQTDSNRAYKGYNQETAFGICIL